MSQKKGIKISYKLKTKKIPNVEKLNFRMRQINYKGAQYTNI